MQTNSHVKQEQEIRDLQRLMENTYMTEPLPKMTKQQDKQALPRVQTEATLPRVQTKAVSPRVPEATQENGKRIIRSTSHLPVATDQQATQRSQRTHNPKVNVDNTKNHKPDQPLLN